MKNEFENNNVFQKAMRDAFEVFINYKIDTKYTTAEMIAGFADRLLRTGG